MAVRFVETTPRCNDRLSMYDTRSSIDRSRHSEGLEGGGRPNSIDMYSMRVSESSNSAL